MFQLTAWMWQVNMSIINYPHINIFHKERKKEAKKERNYYHHYKFINLCVDKRAQYNMSTR